MERGVGNTFAGYQEPHYHNYIHHHHHQQQQHGGYHHYGQKDMNDHRFHHQQYDHDYSQQNVTGGQNGSYCGGGFGFNGGGRKRGFQSAAGATPDSSDGGTFPKLYVAPVPRTVTEEDIRSMFGEHGNVVEVIIPRDKRTGERGAYCFVKYQTFGESDRAIAALQNQYTFPGEVAPIKVRYADGERDRVGQVLDKLYVGGLNKLTAKWEIQEVFSAYGLVEDIYVVRDELKQSRGCAFVQFSRREMAVAAIKALNGVFTMRGCDQPLIVKFADPKKPRTGETRCTPNASFPMQQALNSHPQAVSQWANQETSTPIIMQQQGPPSQLTHFSQQSSQSCQPAVSEIHKQMHHDKSPQNIERQQKSEAAKPETRSDLQKTASVFTTAPQDPRTMTLECDWSEHTCPDGYKYYYNCETCKSTWEKPQEYSLFEKQLHGQKGLQDSAKLQSPSPNCSSQEVAQNRKEQPRTDLLQEKFQVQQSSLPISPSLNCSSQEASQSREKQHQTDLLQEKHQVQKSSLPTSPSLNCSNQATSQYREERPRTDLLQEKLQALQSSFPASPSSSYSSQEASQNREKHPHTDLLQENLQVQLSSVFTFPSPNFSSQEASQDSEKQPTDLLLEKLQVQSSSELENMQIESETSLAVGATCG